MNGVTHYYYYDGINLVKEEWGDNILVFFYDANGAPVGMQYRDLSDDEGDWETYLYEKNLQGDIVAVYNTSGTKLVSYRYDAWGRILGTSYHNGGASTSVVHNPMRYRGYYYDTDLNLYYLATRYYDPEVRRFVTMDDYSVLTATPMGLTDKNLFAYCDNNPITRVDNGGEFWKEIWSFVCNVADAVYKSIETDAGLGHGVGVKTDVVSAKVYRDFYVGLDDGEEVAGNVIAIELKAIVGIELEFDHRTEQGGRCTNKTANAYDGPLDMLTYPETKVSLTISMGNFGYDVINNEFKFSSGNAVHAILGGHYAFGFNFSEFFRRLRD